MLEFALAPDFLQTHTLVGFRLEQGVGLAGTLILNLRARSKQRNSVFSQLSQLQGDIGAGVRCSHRNWTFSGFVDSITYNDESRTMDVTVLDNLHRLDFLVNSRVHADTTVGQVAQACLAEFDNLEVACNLGELAVSLAIQYQETTADFLIPLLLSKGGSIWSSSGRIHISDGPLQEKVTMREGEDLYPLRIQMASGVEKVDMVGIAYAEGNRVQESMMEGDVEGNGPLQEGIIQARNALTPPARLHHTRESADEANLAAVAAGFLKVEAQDRLTLLARTSYPLNVGSQVEINHADLEGVAGPPETLAVSQVGGFWSECMSKPLWECRLVAPEGFGVIARPSVGRVRMTPALVEETSAAANQVKVILPWDVDRRVTPWLRMSTVSWGEGHMAYLPPRVGDTVLLVWGQDDVDPFVLGALSSGVEVDSPERALVFESGNGHRVAVGEELISVTNQARGKGPLRVEVGPDRVTVTTGNGNAIFLGEDCCRLEHSAGSKVELSAKGITLESPGDITIKSGGGSSVVLSGPAVKVNEGALEVI